MSTNEVFGCGFLCVFFWLWPVFTSGSGPVLNAALSVLKTQWFREKFWEQKNNWWFISGLTRCSGSEFYLFGSFWCCSLRTGWRKPSSGACWGLLFWLESTCLEKGYGDPCFCLFVCFLNGLLTFVSAEQQTDETYARWSDWFDKKRTNKKTFAEHVKLGPGFAKTIWRWSRWSSYVGIAITLVLFAVFFGAILWDAVVDFGLSVLFLLCSLAALAYVMYHNHTRAQNWILFLW